MSGGWGGTAQRVSWPKWVPAFELFAVRGLQRKGGYKLYPRWQLGRCA
jgi:hypothetical protein